MRLQIRKRRTHEHPGFHSRHATLAAAHGDPEFKLTAPGPELGPHRDCRAVGGPSNHCVRKVIDCSCLGSEELAQFLKKSCGNAAVLTDFCVMESFNRGEGVCLSYQTLSRHPGQVLVLETTPYIARVRPRSKGLVNRFIDREGTANFPKYCRALASGASMAATNFEFKRDLAQKFIDELTPAAEALRSPMIAMLQKQAPDDLNILRSQKRLTPQFVHRACADIAVLTAELYRDIPGFGPLPGHPEVLYSFPFRLSVCHYALAAHWTWKGGLHSWPAPKLRNDITDCTYAAHASFFDGLITGDGRFTDVYNLSIKMFLEVFGLTSLTVRKIPGEKIGGAGLTRLTGTNGKTV